MIHQIIPTSDGSVTIYNHELDETYHSRHGAIQESRHVFIKNGFNEIEKKEINLLEVGLGTGLNLFLTFLRSIELGKMVNYTAIEPFSLNIELMENVNYISELKAEKYKEVFSLIHSSDFRKEVNLSDTFKLFKIDQEIIEVNISNKFDLIYFDAFGPRVQPEMWTKEVFHKIFSMLNNDGVLVTYCAKGEVKRNLKSAGFLVETLPGPPGKREMTRAKKRI